MSQKRTFEFTDRVIKGLPIPPKPRQDDYFDTKAGGLGCRVSYGGKKSFFILYGPASKRQRLTLGQYGRLEDGRLSLAVARRQARAKLGAVAGGTADPAAEARAQRQAAAVEEIARDWIEARKKSDKPRSWEQQEKRLERHILPVIGHIKGSELETGDVEALLDEITERGSPIMANRLHEIVKAMLGWALKKKRYRLTHNVALAWDRNPANKRDRFLSMEEIAGYWEALDEEGEAPRDALRLCLLLGQRQQSVLGLQRNQLFLDDRIWRVPARSSKTAQIYKVPLSGWALTIIKARIAAIPSTEQYLFSKRGGGEPAGLTFLGIPHRRACARAGIAGYAPHDHRHTFSTHCDAMGIPRLIWDPILGHSVGGMADLYSGFDFADQRLDCVEKWAARIATAAAENVVELKRRPA